MDNLPPGCRQSDIDRQYMEEHECEAGPKRGKYARCIICDETMEREG